MVNASVTREELVDSLVSPSSSGTDFELVNDSALVSDLVEVSRVSEPPAEDGVLGYFSEYSA